MRLVLGLITSFSLLQIQRAVAKKLGAQTGLYFGLLLVSQFHLLFYASRFLPNTFALILSNLALASLIRDESSKLDVVFFLTFGTAVFRCDLVLLIAPVALWLLLRRKLSLARMLVAGFCFTSLSVLLTVSIDSVFWGRLLWPELEVFLFNNPSGDNKSSQWGTAPPLWYFTSALPKCLGGSAVFMLFGFLYERRVRPLGAIALSYISLYSLLPHKEARFIFPVLPYLNVMAAAGLDRLTKRKCYLRSVSALFSIFLVSVSLAHVYVSAVASSLNYPGGLAMEALHEVGFEERRQNISVHIGVFPAMTGVSRFGEAYDSWTYSKVEDLPEDALSEVYGFDYLLNTSPQVKGYRVLKEILGFNSIGFPRDWKDLRAALLERGVPVKFRLSPQVYLHRKLL